MLLTVFFSFFKLNAQIVISEIMYNPPESGTDSLEYIELYNRGSVTLNLQDYTFSQGVTYTFGNINLSPGEYFVLAVNSSSLDYVFGAGTADDQWLSGGLSNGGETIELLDNLGAQVDIVTYDNIAPWPLNAAGLGSSIKLCDASFDNNDPTNWIASNEGSGVFINSYEVKGSPGSAGVCQTTPATHLNFDGVNDYITLSNESNFDFTNQMTVEFWMNSNVVSEQWDALVTKGDDSWRIALTSDGAIAFTATGAFTDFYSTTFVTDGNWHHVAVTYDGAFAKIYIDGSLENQLAGTSNINNSNYNVSLGENLQMTGRYYTGNMDEARIWNTARTIDQINASKNCELQGNETGLIAYYQFNQGVDQADNTSITTLTDNTATNANNGTLSNFTLNRTASNWLAGSPITSNLPVPSIPIDTTPVTYTQGDTATALTATTGIGGVGLLWYTTATGGTASTTAPTPNTSSVGSTSYWVSSTNGNGCESDRVEIVVTVNASTAAPTTTWTTQVYTGDDKTIADIQVTGSNITWYDSPSGGSVLPTTTSLLDGGTAYASQTVGGIESTDRLAVTVKRISDNTQTLPPASTVADLVATPSTGATAQWFANATGGTALSGTDVLTNGVYYVEQQTTAGIETLGSGFNLPTGVAIQTDGKIVVADNTNNTIKRMDADGSNIETLGSGFYLPYGVAIQDDGKIVVADANNNAIKRMNADGSNIETLGNGFYNPRGVAIQADGKIVVADTGNGGIKRMNADGSNIETLGSGFDSPRSVAIQADGKIVVANIFNNAIRRMDSDGSNIETLGSGFSGSNGVTIQVDGKIVVADTGNGGIKRMNADGSNIETLGSGFYAPYGVAIQADGKIVVADSGNNAIKRITEVSTSNRVPVNVAISSPATPTTTWTTQVYTGDDKTIADIQVTGSTITWYDSPTGGMVLPTTISLLDNGTAYASQTVGGVESTDRLAVTVKRISDNTQTLPPASTVADLVTTPSAGTTAQWFANATGGTALPGTDVLANGVYYVEQQTATGIETLGSGFNYPSGVAIQTDGKIVVVDSGNNTVKRMDFDGNNIETLGSGFNNPTGVAIQSDGKIVVADKFNNAIKRMDSDASNIVTLGSGFSGPSGVAIQTDGKIVVADTFNNTIKRMDSDGGNIEVLGSGFSSPTGVAIQADGKIIIAGFGNSTIKRMDSDGSNIVTLGSGFSMPFGVSIQSDGKIVVADYGNNAIKRMNADGSNIEILAYGAYSYPNGVTIQADGNIVVADSGNSLIKRITEASTSNRVPVNVDVTTLGTSNFDANSFKIYPNPSTGIFTIDTKEEVQIEVFDLVGKMIKKENIHIGVNSIDVTNYANGVYLLRVNNSGKINTYRLVKQ
ncbi:LamG-like jellyroll fold domain-containing protein [Flavobacterium sp. U410]